MKHYSTQPRKQRLAAYTRNAHDRCRAMGAHLSDELLKEYSRMRTLTVRKGDTVKVVRGAFKGQVAKVIKVFPRKGMISIEEATLTKADNKKVARLFRPSKVIITKLDLSDPWRREKLQQFKGPASEQKREDAAEKEAKVADKEERAAETKETVAEKKAESAHEKKAEHHEAPHEKKPEHKEAPKAEHKQSHSKEASK